MDFEDGKFMENALAQAVENLNSKYHLKGNSFDF